MKKSKIQLKALAMSFIWMMAVSCTSSSVIDEPDTETESGKPITFGAQVSRAIVDTQKQNMEDFSVWGGYGGLNNLFDAEKVSPAGNYAGVRYWKDQEVHHFYALHPHPASLKASMNASVTCSSTGSLVVRGYDGSRLRGNQGVDVMTAFPPVVIPDGILSPAPVNFTFKHQMAWVDFVIASEQEIEITDIHLTNVVYGGDLEISPRAVEATWINERMTHAITGAPLNQTGLKITKELVKKPVYLLGGSLLLPPQTLTDQCVFTMKWTYTHQPTESREVNVMMPQTGITAWGSGNHYVYSAIIPPTPVEVTLSVSVEPWKSKKLEVIL